MKYILLLTCLIMGHQSQGLEFFCETIDGQDGYKYLKEESQTSVNQEYDASILRRLAFCQLDQKHNKVKTGLKNLRKAAGMGDIPANLALGVFYRDGGNYEADLVNPTESIKWYNDVLQKINSIPDYPNMKLTSLAHNEIHFKIHPDTLLNLVLLHSSQYYYHGFSLYKETLPSEREASELQQMAENNQHLLEQAEGPLKRCLTDERALEFEERARNLGVKEPALRKYHKYQKMVREDLCPLYRTLLDRAYQMEETIYNQAPLCASAGSSSAAPCQEMDREVEAYNQIEEEYLNQHAQIRDACNCF